MLSLLLLAVAALPSALAHGYVDIINTTSPAASYSGYLPYSDPYINPPVARIVRKIPGNGPVENVSLIDVQCNGYTAGGSPGSAPAPIFATVAAGSQVKLRWTQWPETHVGPIITYMAKVPSGSSVTSWVPGTDKVWFKVDEKGRAADGTWAATHGLTATGSWYTFTVPSSLAPGQYIIRHEIIALHSASTYPGAQVYPSCIQVQVTGSGTKAPSSDYLVAFPGAYTSSTPGIVFDAYKSGTYPIPGPKVWSG